MASRAALASCLAALLMLAAGAGVSAFGGTSPKEDALSQFRGDGPAPTLTRGLRGVAKPADFTWKPVVVVLAHSRRQYLTPTLCSLTAQADPDDFDFAVSVDSPKFEGVVREVINECKRRAEREGRAFPEVAVWAHPLQIRPKGFRTSALYKIARHFRLAMDTGFVKQGYSHMVLVEEDLELSPDFLAFFRETAWLLHVDHSLWCVSAWNDNGFKETARNENRLFRTGYFPGLGWMLRSNLWTDELASKWPLKASTGWDHWMRLTSVAKSRECVVPEVSRTKHIGDTGANVNAQSAQQFHKMAWARRLPKPRGQLTFGDLFYLMQQDYERLMQAAVDAAQRVSGPAFLEAAIPSLVDGAALMITYERTEWNSLAVRVGLPAGAPRSTHKGLTAILFKGAPLLLADRRVCPYLRATEQIRPDPAVQYRAAKQGESCTKACRAAGMRCRGDHLQWANNCEVLARLFPCEAGCGHQIGEEIPCYVQDRSQVTHQQCLTTDGPVRSCDASHRSTSRVCPCVR